LQKKNIIFFIIIVIIIVAGSIVISGNFSSKPGRPPQIIISEEDWDFGLVKPGEKPTHVFTVKNEGNEDLIIERAWTSCGCVQTSISSKRIFPGKSAKLKAVFDSSTEWNMGLISQGDILNLRFPIENLGDAELIIDKIVTYEQIQYNATLPLKILPKEKFELILTYNSAKHKLGDIREAAQIYCNDPTSESFFIRIGGYIKDKEVPEISITPTGAILNLAADSGEGAMGKFTIKNSGDETVKIISIKSSAGYLAPLRSEFNLISQKEQDLHVVLLKDKAREEIKESKTEVSILFPFPFMSFPRKREPRAFMFVLYEFNWPIYRLSR